MKLSEDQIIQLAPDSASVKAGQQLANNAKWVTKYVHEKAMWGDCQGSGKNPYRTMVDLQQVAFKCSCPSRKFPCKHGLGLLFLHAQSPGVFTGATELEPQVEEWLGKRESKSAAKPAKESKPTDNKAQEKRAEEREKKVSGGMEELRTWLKDLVRNGIMHIPAAAHKFSSNIVARMVDAQAPAVASSLRRLSDLNYYQDGWQKPFLRSITSLYLLTEAHKNIAQCDATLQADIRMLIGWSIPKEQVLETAGLTDNWAVLAKTYDTEERLTVEKIWLYSYQSERFALLLSFYGPGQSPQQALIPGTTVAAELVFYPSAVPMRALVKQQKGTRPVLQPATGQDFAALLTKVSDTLAVMPFAVQIPFIGDAVRVVYQNQSWHLADASDSTLPLLNPEPDCWRMLAITGGATCTAFIIYEPAGANIHSFWFDYVFYTLT
ncbi:SWIM zinc finger family protein [Pontibacter saemangeumensis]|uniref:SWIM zinc finger family protein n=1 Tax=Pontibacter saemangeumensis TaxID=1084525 RepID=A0ABP8M503_9BACT